MEEEAGHYENLSAYIEYYNEDRLHGFLDIDSYQTTLRAFSCKKAAKAIRKCSPNWMGVGMTIRHNFHIIQLVLPVNLCHGSLSGSLALE